MPQLSREGEAALTNIIPRLYDLTPGKDFVIEDTFHRVEKARMHLYRFLQIEGLSKQYKLQRISPTSLRVTMRSFEAVAIRSETLLPSSPAELLLKSILATCHSLDEASDAARDALNSKQITEEEFITVLAEYERVTDADPAPTLTDLRRASMLADPFAELPQKGDSTPAIDYTLSPCGEATSTTPPILKKGELTNE